MIGPLSRIAIVLSLVLAFASLPSRTQAADTVTNATPADGATLDAVPSQVVLSFLESIDPETVQIVVIAPNGARADTGETLTTGELGRSVDLRPGLTDGRYLVYWLVAEPGSRASAFGDLSFTVDGAPPCQPVSQATPRPPAEECVATPPAGLPGEKLGANDIFVTVTVSGSQAGPVDLRASVTGASGDPVEGASVWFRARHLDMDHGELPYLAAETEPGVYQVTSVGMGMGGQWRIAVDVIQPGAPPLTVFVELAMTE